MMVWAVSLATTELSPRSLTAELLNMGIRSLIGLAALRPVKPIQCSTPHKKHSTPVLKLFRREPAIAKLD